MNLNAYVERLQEQLAANADAAGEEARQLAERLAVPLESTVRLVLLEVLSQAADEITGELAPGSVEVRLRAGEPEFVVSPAPLEEEYRAMAGTPSRVELEDDDSSMARLNLRLPESLKQRIEEAAGTEGLSLNAWLIRAAGAALDTPAGRRHPTGGDRYTGWIR